MGIGCPDSPGGSSSSLGPAQQSAISQVVSESLQTPLPQSLDDTIRAMVQADVSKGMINLRDQYVTFQPAICEDTFQRVSNNDTPPEWVDTVKTDINSSMLSTMQSSIDGFPTKCQASASSFAGCGPVSADGTSPQTIGFSCNKAGGSDRGTCTLDLGPDKVLYIAGDMVVGNELIVAGGLSADTVTGLRCTPAPSGASQ